MMEILGLDKLAEDKIRAQKPPKSTFVPFINMVPQRQPILQTPRTTPIKTSNGACIGYVVGKQADHSYEKGKARRATQVLGLVHSDLIGPLPTPSYGGSIYVFTFIDDFSRFCWVYFLKLKSEVFETLKVWKSLVENQCVKKIKFLSTDNVKYYVNNIM